MSDYATDLQLFNAALTGIGESAITQNDGSAEADLFRERFARVKRAQLGQHAVGFARKVEILTQQGTSGNTPNHVYQLPADFLLAHWVTVDNSKVEDYEIRSGKLLSPINSDALALHYTYNAPVNRWSDAFAEAMVRRCEGLIFRLHERRTEAAEAHAEATRMFLDAQAIDRNQQSAPKQTVESSLVRAHRGGGRHGARRATS